MVTVRVATWNVLAAPWAAPAFYPDGMDPTLLDREQRAALVGAALVGLDADVVCLQETTPHDLATILATADAYDLHTVSNGEELWANWATPELAWESNGTAIAWRRDAFTDAVLGQLSLGGGNVATTVELTHTSGASVRAVSVHLDVDHPELRRAQLPIALAMFPAADGAFDLVAGDCNEDTVGTDLGSIVAAAGFVDALNELEVFGPTHPYARPGDDWTALARLDHVLVRGATPVAGQVVDAGTWAVDIPGIRMAELLRRTGSDHDAVVSTVELG